MWGVFTFVPFISVFLHLYKSAFRSRKIYGISYMYTYIRALVSVLTMRSFCGHEKYGFLFKRFCLAFTSRADRPKDLGGVWEQINIL